MIRFSAEAPEPPAPNAFPDAALAWAPIDTFDRANPRTVFLRNAQRSIVGTWSHRHFAYVHGELTLISDAPKQWGEVIDGDFHPQTGFEPTEWAAIPNEMFDHAVICPTGTVLPPAAAAALR